MSVVTQRVWKEMCRGTERGPRYECQMWYGGKGRRCAAVRVFIVTPCRVCREGGEGDVLECGSGEAHREGKEMY